MNIRLSSPKYYLSLAVLYMNYFLHGVGCSILGQSVIKESLASNWGSSAMAITSIAAALGLGRLVALPIAGPLSDKLGRKASTAIGGLLYAVYLMGIALSMKAGASGYMIAYSCAVIGGIANSFLDTGIYPAVGAIVPSAPGAATMGLKFSMAISQMLLPFFVGLTIGNSALIFWVCGCAYLLLALTICLLPLPTSDTTNTERKSLISAIKEVHFTYTSAALVLIGFTCTGTFQLWLNCAQNFAKDIVGWDNPSIIQSYYSAGTLLAIIVTSLLTRKIKESRFFIIYPLICLITLICVLLFHSRTMMIIGGFAIGWAGAGGLLQLAASACNQLFPKIGGSMTALLMFFSSLCNYTVLTAAASMSSSGVIVMNIVITSFGVVLGLIVNKKQA